ncbi:response regulator [Peristeroidobacter soli]|jgi:DNA-binding response OmpR family regulator|uniref:response regulator n=1 Tax=Peristeroidobacter soli TaxID=2497877 RepID=UPI00101CF29F|nr:response regulator [Peristeroidobacter soli]
MATPDTQPSSDESLSEHELGMRPRPRVLVVDDELRTLRIFRRVLLQIDAHCMVLERAADVAAVLRDHSSIEVVISDLHLSGIDGLELIRQIRARFGERRNIQFILVSGQMSMESAIGALRLEAIDFLFKPVMPRDLLESVRRAMFKTRGPMTVSSPMREHLSHYGQEYDSLRFLKRLHGTRVRLFGQTLLPDPAWGILAELMRAALTGRRVAVTALCVASKAPFTTALRRIDDLIDAGLAARRRDPSDRRRSYIELTDTGHQKMQRYLRNVAVDLVRPSERPGRR